MNIGDRVGAILKADLETVYLLGYGVFDGDQVLPERLALFPGHLNPRLTLDNGRQVFQVQCYWGTEDEIKNAIGKRKVINVGPQELINNGKIK